MTTDQALFSLYLTTIIGLIFCFAITLTAPEMTVYTYSKSLFWWMVGTHIGLRLQYPELFNGKRAQ